MSTGRNWNALTKEHVANKDSQVKQPVIAFEGLKRVFRSLAERIDSRFVASDVPSNTELSSAEAGRFVTLPLFVPETVNEDPDILHIRTSFERHFDRTDQ